MTDLSIVIVSWNALRYVEECLTSLTKACVDLSCEIFVIDNASSDGTPEAIAQEFPEVRLIRNATNLGFAQANNIGLKVATGKYVALINSDVNVPPGCLQKMIAYLEKDASVGLLGPKMLTPSGLAGPSCMRRPSLRIWFAHAFGLPAVMPETGLHMPNPASLETREVDVLNGWFWMVRRSALDQVGVLDEQFFMYGEDIDWCHRFWDNGWKVVYYSEAEALHYGGASSGRAPVRFYVEMQRANLQYWKVHHNLISQMAFVLIVFLHQFLRLLGYSAVYLCKPLARVEAAFKIRRSAACLRWLTGLLGDNETQLT